MPQINHGGITPGELFAKFEEERIHGLERGGFTLAEQPTHESAEQGANRDADQQIGQGVHSSAERPQFG